jgi:hypothetical protein
LRIRLVNGVGASEPSDSFTATPSKIPVSGSKPKKVAGLICISTGKSIMKISWQYSIEIGVPVSEFQYSLRLKGAPKFSSWKTTGLKTSAILKKLKKTKKYEIRIRAGNNYGYSAPTTKFCTQTK